MFRLESVLRPHILSIVPYRTARDEFRGEAEIFLDANENPHGGVIHGPFSRYPDPQQKRLKVAFAKIRALEPDQVFVSHGSDEGIELLIRACAEPGKDEIIVMPPTYSMYQISAQINNVAVNEVPLTEDFEIDLAALEHQVKPSSKIIFLCSPNNPTGTVISAKIIEQICEKFSGLVVVDEAYIDFCPDKSVVPLIDKYANLVVLQTLSKAWGLPGLRIGVVLARTEIVSVLTKIKAPYNISGATQELALNALRKSAHKEALVAQIVASREQLKRDLEGLSLVTKVEPSEANFLLVRFVEPIRIYQALLAHGIVVRDRSTQQHCQGGLRISIGTPYENAKLVAAMKELNGDRVEPVTAARERRALIRRETSETSIIVALELDGSGETFVSTGLGFFDHMLNQVGRHSGINLSVSVQGDLDIDEHHTVEDVGIAFGDALRIALGEKRGIERYGFTAPMDEAQAAVCLDFSGRAFLRWQVAFDREFVGDLPTELVKHFFHSLAESARLTLHVSCDGENEHHKIEAIFKAFAQALKSAVRQTGAAAVPSTKGVL